MRQRNGLLRNLQAHVACQIFFFSSRRRHTRLQGDWSSDVCSSDLSPLTSESGTESVLMISAPGSTTRTLIVADAVVPTASCTWKTTLVVPNGVPARTAPLSVPSNPSVIPEGSVPEVVFHVYGCTPPEAERLAWYCTLREP